MCGVTFNNLSPAHALFLISVDAVSAQVASTWAQNN